MPFGIWEAPRVSTAQREAEAVEKATKELASRGAHVPSMWGDQ